MQKINIYMNKDNGSMRKDAFEFARKMYAY